MEAEDIRDVGKELMELDRREKEQKGAVMAQIKAKVSPEAFADIEAFISESGHTYDYKIADKPKGDDQGEKWAFGSPFVNQTTNGGWSGDEFAGTVSIPLSATEFLEFHYSM